jgi:hypothetical protein
MYGCDVLDHHPLSLLIVVVMYGCDVLDHHPLSLLIVVVMSIISKNKEKMYY